MGILLVALAVFGAATLGFYPTFAYPHGDEATYISYARNPWTNISPFFEGFRPKAVQNPYNFRLFLAPMSAVTAIFGHTSSGTRALQLLWGLLLLWCGYRIGKRMGSPGAAIGAMGALAFTPYFLFFTHGIRPEGMFSMWLMSTALVLLAGERPGPRTWAAVAFLSSCSLWIHYNGVVMPVIFFLAIAWYDRRAVTRAKLTAYVLGGAGFLALYVPLNIVPALETIREFGILPVTFASTNRIPVAHEGTVAHALAALRFYFGYVEDQGGWWMDPRKTGLWTLALAPFALASLCFRDARRERTLALLWLLTAAAMLFVFPNYRPEYCWYLVPWMFVLAGRGLGRLPGRVGAAVTVLVLGTVLVVLAVATTREVRRFAQYAPANAETVRLLRRAADGCGAATPCVLGGQEFLDAVPDTEFRTFHSMLSSGSLARTIAFLEPDVVIQHTRGVLLVSDYLRHTRSPDTPPIEFILAVNRGLMATLEEAGFRRMNEAAAHWDDQEVVVWMKKRDG